MSRTKADCENNSMGFIDNTLGFCDPSLPSTSYSLTNHEISDPLKRVTYPITGNIKYFVF